MDLKGKAVLVTGGSRGLGLGLVEVLVERGADVTVLARDRTVLTALQRRLGVRIVAADVTDAATARQTLADVRPDVLVLNAGTTPAMGPIDQLSWENFSASWNTDVRSGLYWIQAALNLPLAAGSRILVASSGAAQQGSPLSGGYAGAKRMLWIMAKYANGVSQQKQLGLRFQALLPLQMVAGTGVGNAGAAAYGQAMGIPPEDFLARFGASMSPGQFGAHVAAALEDRELDNAIALGFKGDSGVTVIEGESA